MSSELLPQRTSTQITPWQAAPAAHRIAPTAAADEDGVPWWRYAAALRRAKWLVVGISALGIAAGVIATRLIRPQYQVGATLWVASDTRTDGGAARGPIRAQALLSSSAWLELLKSFATTEPVARRLNLFVVLDAARDSALFAHVAFDGPPRPGKFVLEIANGGYVLEGGKGVVIERGAVGDSIGRSIGFKWRPPAALLSGSRTVSFVVKTPREAAMDMVASSSAVLPEESNFLRISMAGEDPQRTARTLNAWIQQFVDEAGQLKRKNLTELAGVLRDQLAISERQLKAAEAELEGFRVNTITLPTEGTAIASGIEQTRDPVFHDFFTKRVDAEATRRDLQTLDRILTRGTTGENVPDALLALPGVVQSSDELRTSLADLYQKRAQLRTLRQTYTDAYGPVRDLAAQVATIERVTVPQIARNVAAQLRARQAGLDSAVAGTSRELRHIPARTIEEMRLRRDVAVAENLYTTLQGRYEEARLAEASAVPDVSILDTAIAPLHPSTNSAPRLLIIVSVASIGLAIAIALLLDHLDRRFRYPKQATHELGLEIIGFLPTLRRSRGGETDLVAASQLIEACRQIRMHIQHTLPGGPAVVAITSPGPGEGKSLTATNLALAFAAEGKRTLLIDGDIRRGALHQIFGGSASPGLLECLSGTSPLENAIRQAPENDSLWFLPRGSRRATSPELLASSRLPQLISELSSRFDAIIIDSAPLGAGVDAFAVAVASGNLLVVLRAGETDRKMAEAKLKLIDRLPIAVVGCVVNDIKPEGVYEYYSYLHGYEPVAEPVVIHG